LASLFRRCTIWGAASYELFNPWLMQTVYVLRELLQQRDQARLEKELMYSSHSLSSRLTEQDELLGFSQ
jgi:hypothetical protein